MYDVIVGTAGHVDHGKSTLVHALTGIDPDRLKEEKQRGITIDLGFAYFTVGPYRISFVDVPGHEKFVKNMLAGIGGIHLVLLVVAADESVMPQTVEHFEICRLLDIPRGIVAVTKSDLVDEETLELVREEVADMVKGSFLEEAPVITVDALSGRGLDALRTALLEQLKSVDWQKVERLSETRVFQLPVDRVFTLRGFGTVVTGTVVSGRISRDDSVSLVPPGFVSRVRGMQVHGDPVDTVATGSRAALNLQGISPDQVYRGMVVTEPGALEPTDCQAAYIELLPDAPGLGKHTPVHLHIGSSETTAFCRVLEQDELAPGEAGWVFLRFQHSLVCTIGRRFVLRRFSPLKTIGGGLTVLPGVRPPRRKHLPQFLSRLKCILDLFPAESESNERSLVRELVVQGGVGGVELKRLVSWTGFRPSHIKALVGTAPLDQVVLIEQNPPMLLDTGVLNELRPTARSILKEFHEAEPLAQGMNRNDFLARLHPAMPAAVGQWVLKRLTDQGELVLEGALVRSPEARIQLSERQQETAAALCELLEQRFPQEVNLNEWAGRLQVPATELERIFRYLLNQKEILRITEDLIMLPRQLQELAHRLHQTYPPGQPFSVPDFKELFGFTRKTAIPLLEFLDRIRITRRIDESSRTTALEPSLMQSASEADKELKPR